MRLTTIGFLTALPLIAVTCTTDTATAPLDQRARVADTTPSATVSTVASCGATIVEDTRLEADLTCTGAGLIIGADDVRLDLNGHTITGPGITGLIGIEVRNRHNVSISGGTIRSFTTGIMVATSTDVVIKDNSFTLTREAVFLAGSSGNTIKSNTAFQNTTRGFMIRPTGSGAQSTDNVVMDNVLTNNPSGILVFGQPGNMFKSNTISQSSLAAFDLTGGGASGNIFKDNVLTNNAAGILFGAGWTGNEFVANTIQTNTCGTKGTTTGNVFKDNLFLTNTTDACP